MKPVIIYHDSCADGFGAAFAAWLKFGKEAIYIPCQHGKGKPSTIDDMCALFDKHAVPSGKNVQLFILDFSFDKPVMDWLFDVMGHIVWLDHHKSAFEMWCGKYERGMQYFETNGCYGDGNRDIILDDKKSGALLAWEWFHSVEDVPLAYLLLDDYDRWQFKDGRTKAFQKALWSFAPWTFESWVGMDITNDFAIESMVVEGLGVLRAHEQHVAKTVKEATMECVLKAPSFKGQNCDDTNYPYYEHSGLAANCPPFLQSDVGHELATKSGTFGLLWCIDKDGQCKCSLRSNGDYDVAAIAKAFGGGGHQNAAGFTVPIQTLLGWLK